MKKQLLSTLLVCVFLIAGPAAAKDVFETLHVPPPNEETSFLMRLMAAGAVIASVEAANARTGMSGATRASIHAAHLMVQLGQISGIRVAKNIGVNMAITAAASGLATTETAKSYVKMMPVIGVPLFEAKEQGVAIVTGWLNDVLGYAYQVVLGTVPGASYYLGLQEEDPCTKH